MEDRINDYLTGKLKHNYKLKNIHTSKKYAIGNRVKMQSGEWLTIIGQLDKPHITKEGFKIYKYFLISFDDNTLVTTIDTCIRAGKIVNPYTPCVCGIGFPGQGIWKAYINGKATKEYVAWHGMLTRCYSEVYHKQFPTYRECSVSVHWHNFQNFCEDILHLDGYASWKVAGSKYQLDKDIKIKGNKIYASNTCQFVTNKENNQVEYKENCLTGLTYIGTRLSDGYVEEFKHQTLFAKKYNLHQQHVNKCILGHRKSHGGWTFITKESK